MHSFHRFGRRVLIPTVAAAITGCSPPVPIVDLVADVNRSGLLEPGDATEDTAEETWDATHGAVLLANLDDDDGDGRADAEDDIVNGPKDIADLMPFDVRAWPQVTEGVTATVTVDAAALDHVRVFRINGPADQPGSYSKVAPGPIALDALTLKTGAQFAIESKHIVTSTAQNAWKGFVDISLVMTQPGENNLSNELGRDVVRARVAPVLLQFDTAPTERVFYTDSGSESLPLLEGLEPATAGAGVALESLQLDRAYDQWTQDFFDVGFMSRPGPSGKAVGMHVFIRSAQDDRDAGQWILDNKLGPDSATLYIFDENRSYTQNGLGYSMNSFGNWSVVPPYETATAKYPLGRNLHGEGDSSADQPDEKFIDFVRAQAVQPDIVIDTSFLLVGHVDEIVSFVKAKNTRGWQVLMSEPVKAREMLKKLSDDGFKQPEMFTTKSWMDWDNGYRERPANISIQEVLLDPDLMAASQAAQVQINKAKAILKQELALEDSEITEMPFLYENTYGASLAYQPGTVNLLYVDGHAVVPDPFGPIVGGSDPFKADIEEKFAALGVEVFFADDWDLYHRNAGEVHCGTNVVRKLDLAWWESGR